MSNKFRVDIKNNRFKAYTKQAKKVYETALNDCLDDLVRTSSASAPHDKGILEKSWSKDIAFEKLKPYGVVSYSVKKADSGGNLFNYALKMHEETYNLGPKSRAKSGGTGMSGKKYPVGKNYLLGVLQGEQRTYVNHIDKKLQKFTKKF